MTTRGRAFLIAGLVLVLALLATPVLWVYVGMQTADGMGSMTEAVNLRPTVEAMSAPQESFANGRTGNINRVFPNGEWVVGVAKDSHALYSWYHGGGTVVLKDSRGRVRCFFGHVCGNGGLMMDPDVKTLDEFDAKLSPLYSEQQWP